MCGICGIWGWRDEALVRKMAESMIRRGPDAEGFFFSDSVSFGHRRLSTIDLQGGRQPMTAMGGDVIVSCNGTIYNYRELRTKLTALGHVFQSQSDTEVILHAYQEYGDDFLRHFNGEFAFSLWDKRRQRLLLVRDRLGIRPLFFCRRGERLAFASDLKALLRWEDARGSLNPQALSVYLALRYTPQAMSMINGIEQLKPGTMLTLDADGHKLSTYWRLAPAEHIPTDEADQIQVFRDLFYDALTLRMRGDVPMAAYLSGGVDSASIVSLMQRMSPRPVRTFTVGGFGPDVDELSSAASLAASIGAEHHEIRMGKDDFELLPEIVAGMSRPIGDAIILPTWLLCRSAGKMVKVVLSGEGADEILAGYVHHGALMKGRYLRQKLGSLFGLAQSAVKLTPAKMLDVFFSYPASLGAKGKEKVLRFLDALASGNTGRQYLDLACVFGSAEKDKMLCREWKHAADDAWLEGFIASSLENGEGFLSSLLRLDLENWLPDYTLAKQDALSMDNSLEARVPFLDHRLVEYAFALPEAMKIHKSMTKYVLRMAMRDRVPDAAVQAPKRSFHLPFERCFSSRFETFAADVLFSKQCLERGIFNRSYLESCLARGRSLELVDAKRLMVVLIAELWMRAYLDNAGG
jgi:asparagine synthase (glutamine-hydrolysing)